MILMDWKRKLTSRKLWLAVAGLVVGVLAMFGVDANMTQQISGVIMSLGSVIAYIVGEGLVDAASAGQGTADITKQDTVEVSTPAAAQNGTDSKITAPVASATQTAAQAEGGATASDTTGMV